MFKKLLLAGSIAALSAASAHAQLSITTTTPVTPALELELPGTPSFVTTPSIVLDAGGSYPANSAMLIGLTLPAGVVFSNPAAPADLLGLDQGALDVTVSTGGAAGSSTVTYLVTSNAIGEERIQYSGGLTLDACVAPGAGVAMTATLTDGTPISGGSATSTAIINECASALDGTVAADGFDTLVLLPAYTSVNDNVLGDINYTIANNVQIDGAGALLTSTEIDSITFDVVFGDGAGVTSVSLLNQTEPVTNGVASFNFDTASGDLPSLVDGFADPLFVTLDGTTQIASQTVIVNNADVTFNDNTVDLIASEAGAEGAIDSLDRQGQTFGVFDWNDGRAGRTTSVYRTTGFNPGQTFDYEIEMTNSIFAAPNNVFRGTATADIVGEFVMTSVGFGSAVPNYGRGDARITFEVTETLDVDRLMVRNGISTEFGDGANSQTPFSFPVSQTPSNDSDGSSE